MRISFFLFLICFVSIKNIYAGPLLKPWAQYNHEEYETGIVTNGAFDGNTSAYIKSRNERASTRGSLWQSIRPPQEWIGKRVMLTAYLKTISVTKGAGLFMDIDAYNEENKDYMLKRCIIGDTEWKQYRIVLDIPQNTSYISFGVWLMDKGEAQVDNFKFEIVDNDVKPTGNYVRKEFGKPRNLNFEER